MNETKPAHWVHMTIKQQDAWLAEHQHGAGSPEASAAHKAALDDATHGRDRRAGFLKTIRGESFYEGPRIAATSAALVASLALIASLWPVARVRDDPASQYNHYTHLEVSPELTFVLVAALLFVWTLRSFAVAYLDRCDLALRRAWETTPKP